MRIHVLGEDTISPQARTYAEYRVFAALTQVGGEKVDHASVVLRRAGRRRGCEGVSCTVTIEFGASGGVRIRTVADHAYAAINHAVERLRDGPLHGRVGKDFLDGGAFDGRRNDEEMVP